MQSRRECIAGRVAGIGAGQEQDREAGEPADAHAQSEGVGGNSGGHHFQTEDTHDQTRYTVVSISSQSSTLLFLTNLHT